MAWRMLAAMLVAAAVFAPAALAQPDLRKCANAEFDSRSEALDELGPFAGASYKADVVRTMNSPSCRIVTFYRLAPKLPEGATVAERRKILAEHAEKTAPPLFAARYIDDSKAANYKPRWTDQTRCPALVPQLAMLEPILAPKITGDGPYRGMSTITTHQPTIRFWMAGPVYPQRDEDWTLDIAMEGGGTAAFGKWLDDTFKALDGCWSADPPVLK